MLFSMIRIIFNQDKITQYQFLKLSPTSIRDGVLLMDVIPIIGIIFSFCALIRMIFHFAPGTSFYSILKFCVVNPVGKILSINYLP